jgi:hypothetical protein
MDKSTEGYSIAPRTGEIVDNNAIRLDLALYPFDQCTMVPQCMQTYTCRQRKTNMIVLVCMANIKPGRESNHLRQ